MVTPRFQTKTPRRGRDADVRWQVEALEPRLLLSADAVLDWNSIALDAVAADHSTGSPEQGGPTRTSRALAIVHAAMFDAVNSIDGSYRPYLMHRTAPKHASIEAAAAQAAHDTLAALYPSQLTTFDIALAQTLSEITDGRAERRGTRIGSLAAKKLLKARQDDGAATDPPYTPGMLPGQHRADPLHPSQGFLGSEWGLVEPFAMKRGDQFRSPPPPPLTSAEYTAAFNEVKAYGGDGVTTPTVRTSEQTEIAIFWGYDGSPGLGTPPRIYNQVVRTISIQEGNSEVENARLFALVNMAMADAGIASWDTKYAYDFWRPAVAIREADPGTGPSGMGDGNPDTVGDVNWAPLGAPCSNLCPATTNFTPPFPAYTSGHATFGAATFEMLKNFYGRDDIAFTCSSDEFNGTTTDQDGTPRPVITRSFTSFSQAAEENSQSRIYLGIHWSFDKTAGLVQGRAVADYAFEHILKVRHHGPN